jgi:cell division septation protein DedD
MKMITAGRLPAAFLLVLSILSVRQASAQDDWFQKGLVLIRNRQYDAAIEAFSAAVELIPGDFQAYNYRGLARTYLADYDGAIADYTKALQIKAVYAEAINNRGFAWVKKGNLKQALDDFSRAIEINPAMVDAYNSKAWILATSSQAAYRNSSQALALAQKAVELNAGIDSLDTLAAAYAAGGQFEEAIATQKRAIQLLIQQERTAGLDPYIDRLNAYKSRQPLRTEYPDQTRPAKYEQSHQSPKTGDSSMSSPLKAPSDKKLSADTYPYTIQVSAYRDPAKSFQTAASLSDKGDPAFACPVHIPGKGEWNRVFIGAFQSLDKAREFAADLKQRKFRYIQVTRKPYSVQVGLFDSRAAAQEIITLLRTKGYTGYSLPDSRARGSIRVLTGAYESSEAAGQLAERLAADGFTPRIVPR